MGWGAETGLVVRGGLGEGRVRNTGALQSMLVPSAGTESPVAQW